MWNDEYGGGKIVDSLLEAMQCDYHVHAATQCLFCCHFSLT